MIEVIAKLKQENETLEESLEEEITNKQNEIGERNRLISDLKIENENIRHTSNKISTGLAEARKKFAKEKTELEKHFKAEIKKSRD